MTEQNRTESDPWAGFRPDPGWGSERRSIPKSQSISFTVDASDVDPALRAKLAALTPSSYGPLQEITRAEARERFLAGESMGYGARKGSTSSPVGSCITKDDPFVAESFFGSIKDTTWQGEPVRFYKPAE